MRKIIHPILWIVLLVISGFNPIFAENIESKTLIKVNYHLERAWEELHKVYHFQKARQIIDSRLEESIGVEERAVLLAKKDILNHREELFRDILGNVFPMGPILSNAYDNQDRIKSARHIAIRNSVLEARNNLESLSRKSGQEFVIFLADPSIETEGIEYSFRLFSNLAYLNPFANEELLNVYPNGLTIEQLKEDPSILMKLVEEEEISVINILYIEDYMHTGNEAYVSANLFRFNASDSETLTLFSKCDATGIYVSEYFVNNIRNTILLFIILVVSFSVFAFFGLNKSSGNNESKSLKQNSEPNPTNSDQINITTNKKKDDLVDTLKAISLSFILILVGLGFSYGIGYGSETIMGSWEEKAGSLKILSYIGLGLAILLVNPLLLLILQKVTDYVALFKKEGYLAFLWASFYSGIGLYIFFFFNYYLDLYPNEDSVNFPYLAMVGMILNGATMGHALRNSIELNSYRTLLDSFKPEEKAKKKNLILALFSGYGAVIVVLIVIACHTFFSFFQADSQYTYGLLLALVIIWFVLQFLEKQLKFEKSNSEFQKKEIVRVNGLEDLKRIVNDTDLIEYISDKSIDKSKIKSKIIDAYAKEGGIILFTGERWSGKNRIIREVLESEEDFKSAEIFSIDFQNNPEVRSFYPFIEGMKAIPEIQSIMDSYKFGSQAKKAAGMLSGLFSFIPIAGDILTKFLDSDIDLTSKENERITLRLLINALHTISKDLIVLHEKTTDSKNIKYKGQIIFILDHFEDVDSGSFHLIKEFIELIQDDERSPEKNNIAFLILAKSQARILPASVNQLQEGPSVLHPIQDFRMNGLDKEKARIFFRNTLRFRPTRKNDDLFYHLFSLYGFPHKDEDDEKYLTLFPKYFTETIKGLLSLEVNSSSSVLEYNPDTNSFLFTGNENELEIPESLFSEAIEKIKNLTEEERTILEVASILGNSFSVKELVPVIGRSEVEILYLLKNLEQKGQILTRSTTHGSLRFKRPIYRISLQKNLFYKNSQGKYEPLQIYTEYCNRITEYFRGKADKNFQEWKRFAEVSSYSSDEYIKDFISSNLEYAEKCFHEDREEQPQGIIALNRILVKYFKFLSQSKPSQFKMKDHFPEDPKLFLDEFLKEKEWLEKYLDSFSAYFNDYQESMTNDFPYLKSFVEYVTDEKNLLQSPLRVQNQKVMMCIFTGKREIAISINDSLLSGMEFDSLDSLWTLFWSIHLSKSSKDPDEIRDILIKIDMGNNKLLKMEKTRESEILRSRFLNVQSEILIRTQPGNKMEIQKAIDECISIKRKYSDLTGEAMLLSSVCDWKQSTQEIEEAIRISNQMIELNESIRNYKGLAYSLLSKLEALDSSHPEFLSEFENLKEIVNNNKFGKIAIHKKREKLIEKLEGKIEFAVVDY